MSEVIIVFEEKPAFNIACAAESGAYPITVRPLAKEQGTFFQGVCVPSLFLKEHMVVAPS